jgi:hypothetical protein
MGRAELAGFRESRRGFFVLCSASRNTSRAICPMESSAPTHLVIAALRAKHARLTAAADLEPGAVGERAAEPETVECSNEYCWCHTSKNGHRAEEKKS